MQLHDVSTLRSDPILAWSLKHSCSIESVKLIASMNKKSLFENKCTCNCNVCMYHATGLYIIGPVSTYHKNGPGCVV